MSITNHKISLISLIHNNKLGTLIIIKTEILIHSNKHVN